MTTRGYVNHAIQAVLCALFGVAVLLGQSTEKRPRLDVQQYTITADINPRTQSVAATAKISFKPIDETNTLVFELNNALRVSKATDSRGASLAFTHNDSDFTTSISLASPLSKNQLTEINIAYEGKLTGEEDSPVYGIRFAALHPDYGFLLYPSRWFPIAGYSTDRFAATLNI